MIPLGPGSCPAFRGLFWLLVDYKAAHISALNNISQTPFRVSALNPQATVVTCSHALRQAVPRRGFSQWGPPVMGLATLAPSCQA